jgi:hypothetical protein
MSTTKAAYLKTTTMIVLAALAIALVSVLWAYTPALAQSSTVTDTRNPKVIAVRPPDGATDVSIVSPNNPHAYHKVVAFFSEDMRERSLFGAFQVFEKGSNTPISDYTFWYNAQKRKAIIQPEIALKRGVTYKAVVSVRAEDLAGNRLDQNRNRDGLQRKVWYFTMEN